MVFIRYDVRVFSKSAPSSIAVNLHIRYQRLGDEIDQAHLSLPFVKGVSTTGDVLNSE